MAGTTLARELAPARASRVEFALASEEDDADLRRLLRENPMGGQVSLSLEREPDFFAAFCGAEQQTIVARERGRLACAGWCVFRDRFVNGTPRRVGYLGGLRLDRAFAGRVDLVRRGYEFFRELQHVRPADFYFTSIAADNVRAQRFLERGLPGLPRYSLLAEFVTVLVPVPSSLGLRRQAERDAALHSHGAEPCNFTSISATARDTKAPSLLRSAGAVQSAGELADNSCQLAPRWRSEELSSLSRHGLRSEDFIAGEVEGQSVRAALWDKRAFKQSVVRDYAWPLRLARPFINFSARLTGQPGLPAVGEPLAHAFVSHLAVAAEADRALVALLHELRRRAAERGLSFLTLGFDARDPRLDTVRRYFRGREYHSRLYAVSWGDLPPTEAITDGLFAPEVALL